MPSNFDIAFDYVCGNEGAYSNDAADKGGATFWGISEQARRDHKCKDHPSGVRDEAFTAAPDRGRDLAKHICRVDYWKFDGIRDSRLATKLLDIVFNVGDPIRLIQRAVDVSPQDGVYGPATEAALTKFPSEQAIEALCTAVADKYVDIARNDAYGRMRKAGISDKEIANMQMTFLKGWIRRAVRRPPLVVKGIA